MVETESEQSLARGEAAPDFRLQGTDGAVYTPESFADDDALLVVFTCNHCPYARAKFGALNGIAAEYDDVAVVGVNPNDAEEYPDDSYERMCELVDEGTVAYDAYLRDDTQSVARAYGAVCTPDPFLFAREGDSEARSAPERSESSERRTARDEVPRAVRAGAARPQADGEAGEGSEPRSDEWRLAYHGRLDDALAPDDEPSGEPGFEMRRAIDEVLAGEDVSLDDTPSRGCSIKWRAE